MGKLDIATATTVFEPQLKQLESLGFANQKKNVKLLRATNGDFEIVKNFLVARDVLKSKSKLLKKDEKFSRKLDKQEKKKDKKKQKREKKQDKPRKERKIKKEASDTPTGNENTNSNCDVFQADNLQLAQLTKDGWPTGVAHLYLDGNNMLYVVAAIRSLVLKRKSAAAESALEALARSFCAALNLKHCTLIFDDTKRIVSEAAFTVCSARPSFSTSDDALVEMAKATGNCPAVYVTSDRELLSRLKQCGNHVILCKPKEWFYFVANTLNGDKGKVDGLDQWMTQWMNENLGSDIAKDLQKLNL